MARKRKLLNVSERCRICLADYGCMSNFSDELLLAKTKDLVKCTSIDIENEPDLPNIICHICLYKLEMWTEFKEQFIRSNKILLSHLEKIEGLDDASSKRKRVDANHSGEDSLSDSIDKKKPKSDVPPLIPLEFASVDCVTDQATLKQLYISEDEPTSSKDSVQKPSETYDQIKLKNVPEDGNCDSLRSKPSLVPMRVKSLAGRRGKTTERRKASTKRWVARKKALLAATGENASDTDSIASDDTQLSPVQKARAKTNADKEAERHKRLAKALKNLETNMSGKYAVKHYCDALVRDDIDADVRRTRSQNVMNIDKLQHNKGSVVKQKSQEDDVKKNNIFTLDPTEKENSSGLIAENVTADLVKKTKRPNGEEGFTPHLVKSELEVGDATYIVTSTLILAQPQYLNKIQVNNLSKDSKGFSIDEGSQEKNTDIIDAVQLRRIRPVSSRLNDKKFVEKCLNIEVEATQLEALKWVQIELAGFVEKEMKDRLFGTNCELIKHEKVESAQKSCYQTLDQQLKHIVERAIKKNFETSMMRGPSDVQLYNPESRTVSPSFVRTAMLSKQFQPIVVVKKLDVVKESKTYKINNMHILEHDNSKMKILNPLCVTSHKRQSVPPAKYNDYNTSLVESNSETSEDAVPVVRRTVNVRGSGKYELAAKKRTTITENEIVTQFTDGTYKSTECNDASRTVLKIPSLQNEQKIEKGCNTSKTSSRIDEKHICGVCSESFSDPKEIELHVRSHKVENVPRHSKPKMMRCKRCHEIVEARFVKSHVCRSTKQIHKCYVCNSTFRTEKLLVRHLESHDQSEFNIENVTKTDSKKTEPVIAQGGVKTALCIKSDKERLDKIDCTTASNKRETIKMQNNQSEKVIGAKCIKSDNIKHTEKPKETYTCFVCDKIFTDEEVLKDHLQKHCDDMSEDEQSTGKEQYQCAICGESLESEDALEAHVEKHLFDDEDDNPNLISIGNENEKGKEVTHKCVQCGEIFNSEMLLEMHMQAHEEEAEIAEWEKRGMKAYEFQCMICDDVFETEEELSEHLDVHNGNAHVCQLCEKPFSSLEDLQRHVATH